MGAGSKTFSIPKKEDERIYRKEKSHCQSLFQQILPLQTKSLTICEVTQSHSNKEKDCGCQTKKGECGILSPSLQMTLGWTNIPNSAQGSRSHISGFFSAGIADGSSVHFHTVSHSPSCA